MNKLIIIITTYLIFYFGNSFQLYAADACSRTALINYQEIMIDSNSNQKGDGLRYHLAKDSKALKYLSLYQKENKTRWTSAVFGTIGTLLLISGVFTNSSETGRQSLLISGASLITLNFLVAKTIEFRNERLLHKAVNEYNRRNLPKIYFPELENSGRKSYNNKSFFINFIKEF
ncbi:MAG: hypothetical protein ISR65_09405 [Bacteriovoracaceae bacterium]|nr:hypothetical protein [Bacteriovoracaceae bacterium]